jgi:hypothetical protein
LNWGEEARSSSNLSAVASPPNEGAACPPESEGGGALLPSDGATPPVGSSTSSLALPLAPGGPRQMRSPADSASSPSTFSPLTKVPVALPASAIASPEPLSSSRAWKGSTLPSMICSPASMLEPTTTSWPVIGIG